MKRAAILAAAVAATLALARPAGAYVRYKAMNGKMFAWPQTCVPMVAFPKDLEQMMTESEILGALNAAAATWSAGANECTYLDMTVESSTEKAPRATNDSRNNIIFRTSSWCKLTPTGSCDPAVPYDSAALALTSVSASTSSGIIRDADVEVNAFHFSWADLVTHPELQGMPFHDLQNAITHEFGHVIGLDHTCYIQPPIPTDQNNNPIPDCMDASPDVLATTMFPSADPGDIEKRTLAPDDMQGLCDIYPKASDPMMCVPPQIMDTGCGGGNCATAAGPPGSLTGLVAALALIVLGARRRRRG